MTQAQTERMEVLKALGYSAEQIANDLLGTSMQANGKARNVRTSATGTTTATLSVADMKARRANKPVAQSSGVPADAPTAVVNGKQYAVFCQNIKGVSKNGRNAGKAYDLDVVKISGLPFSKDSWDIETVRTFADPEFQSMLATFIEEYDTV